MAYLNVYLGSANELLDEMVQETKLRKSEIIRAAIAYLFEQWVKNGGEAMWLYMVVKRYADKQYHIKLVKELMEIIKKRMEGGG